MPYFPRNDITSNIGEERLNFCVRDGNRCTPLSRTTKTVLFNLRTPVQTGVRLYLIFSTFTFH